jgi:hypothetical protein
MRKNPKRVGTQGLAWNYVTCILWRHEWYGDWWTMWQACLAFALVQNLDLRVRCPHFQDYKDAKREGQSQSSFCIWPVRVNPKYFTLLEYDFWLNYALLFPLKKSRKCEQFCSGLMTGMRCSWRHWLLLSHPYLTQLLLEMACGPNELGWISGHKVTVTNVWRVHPPLSVLSDFV